MTSACAINSQPKWATASTNKTVGGVKIGKPYQINGIWYYPEDDRTYDKTGIASWYGPGFHGKYTANGEVYNQDDVTAAHKTLPMPSFVEVTNLENGRKMIVRINDRGPYVDDRIIDLSRRSAQLLDVQKKGTARVRVRRVFPNDAPVSYAKAEQPKPAPAPISVPAPIAAAPILVAQAAPTPAPTSVPAPAPAPAFEPPVRTVSIPASEPKLSSPPLVTPAGPTSFVQVAAVSNPETAQALVGKLAQYGSTQMDMTASGLYRVRVGPFVDKDLAAATLAKIKAAGYGDALLVDLPPS